MDYRFAFSDKTPTPVDRFIADWRNLLPIGIVALVAPPLLFLPVWWLFGSTLQWFLSQQFMMSLLMMGLSLFIIIHLCAACILAERKISAFIQDRKGPNRVGWGGLLQPIADGIKFILKEDVIPRQVDRGLYMLAPVLSMGVALLGFAVVPWAGEIQWPWDAGTDHVVTTQVAPLDIGILYVLAVGSLGVYGIVLAGWASNSKYPFYGGLRATAQMLSYEIPLGLAVLILIVANGSLRLDDWVNTQAATGLWNIFVHPIAFFLLLIAAIAESNRAPFDVVECEQELVGGYHTEYSSMKFAMFFLAEYSHMVIASAIVVGVFLGGWSPFPFFSFYTYSEMTWWTHSWSAALIKFSIYWVKVLIVLWLYMQIRWTLPRFRFDQVMRMSWKGMIPVGVAVFALTALMPAIDKLFPSVRLTIDPSKDFFGNFWAFVAYLVLNLFMIGVMLFMMARSTAPVTGRQEHMPELRLGPSAT